MECPKCGTELGKANYCGCGWKGKAPKDAPKIDPRDVMVNCEHWGCSSMARVKTRMRDGKIANVCLDHYYAHWNAAG